MHLEQKKFLDECEGCITSQRWVGKVAIVTGASAGIGAAIVEQLVKAGLNVVGLARRLDRLEELAKKLSSEKGKLYPYKADITSEDDIIKAFEWTSKNVGPVNILINNAGIVQITTLSEGRTEQWLKVINTNIVGLCIATREAVKIMKANNIQGHIIHINSTAGHSVPNFPNMNVYPATKHAVTALTETLRHEFNRESLKIKITDISPGATDTEIAEAADPENYKAGNFAKLKATMPFLKSEDVADAVYYALSTPPHVQISEIQIKPVGSMF